MISSLTFSIQHISMFLTFRFFRDWEFRAMKTQEQDWDSTTLWIRIHNLNPEFCSFL
jgi:hypothetical protein